MKSATPAFVAATPPSRTLWLGVAALALFAGLWLHGPVAQWVDYHGFADTRVWLGIPHAADVLSNLPFLFVGAFGLWRLSGASRGELDPPSRKAWQLFCVALLGTSAGSAFYHWAPNNAALVFDRIPIAWACVALTGALLAEHVHSRWAAASVLAAAVAIATGAVAYWWFTEQGGLGDLRPYLFVQVLPMLLVPLALLLSLPPLHAAATPASAWWGVLVLYGAAKAMEVADHQVFSATGWVSGHTLKHLLAAAGAAWIVLAVTRSDAPQLR
ncbi:MAG: hypothetical protein WA210_24475 [Burkholderiaceae bacterium]